MSRRKCRSGPRQYSDFFPWQSRENWENPNPAESPLENREEKNGELRDALKKVSTGKV